MDSGFEDFTDESCPEIKAEISAAEVVRNDIKLEVTGWVLSESGVPFINIRKNDSCHYLGKRYEDRKLLHPNQDRMLEELKTLLSNEVMSLMQETEPTWQVLERVNRLTEENIDLKAAINESTCNEQSLDESFEVLL